LERKGYNEYRTYRLKVEDSGFRIQDSGLGVGSPKTAVRRKERLRAGVLEWSQACREKLKKKERNTQRLMPTS